MNRNRIGALIGVALLTLTVATAGAEQLTVNSILAAQQSGARADGIIAMINDPGNTVVMTAADMPTLRSAGVPEPVITAIWPRLPVTASTPAPLQPDDARLVDFARLIRSGMDEANLAEQIRQSGQVYSLTVNDLLYLKQNGARETTIAALMATSAGPVVAPGAPEATPPAELVFDDLVFVKPTFLKGNREGRLVMRDNTLSWVDNDKDSQNFTFQTNGLEKVWFTCEARTPENFCYQINFQVIKGDRYRFQDSRRATGSNAAVTRVMDALRMYFPRLAYGTPDN